MVSAGNMNDLVHIDYGVYQYRELLTRDRIKLYQITSTLRFQSLRNEHIFLSAFTTGIMRFLSRLSCDFRLGVKHIVKLLAVRVM